MTFGFRVAACGSRVKVYVIRQESRVYRIINQLAAVLFLTYEHGYNSAQGLGMPPH